MHAFTARISQFDRHHPLSSINPFRGFYTLFWLMVGVTGVRMILRVYEEEGILLGLEFGRFIGQDSLNVAISDAVLVGVTILCVPFVKVSPSLSRPFAVY